MIDKKTLRKEHNKRVISGEYKRLLGNVCCNCGSTDDIEYHHIVPLCMGGTNKMTNIVPVCFSCHQAIHGEKNYRAKIHRTKTSKTANNVDYNKAILLYIDCKMDVDTLKSVLGVTGNLCNSNYYKRFLKTLGIKSVYNKVKTLIEDCNYPPPKSTEVGRIYYTNGDIKSVFYE